MKMKYSALFLNFLLFFSLSTAVVTETACNSQSFATVVTQIEAELPAAQAAATAILSLSDPAVVPLIAPTAAVVSTDLEAVKAAIAAYQASPTTTAEQKIQASVDALLNTVNGNLLSVNGLHGAGVTQAQQVLSAFAAVWAVIDGFIVAKQSTSQAQAHAAQHQAKLEQILPLLNHQVLDQAARAHGTTLDRAVHYEIAMGF